MNNFLYCLQVLSVFACTNDLRLTPSSEKICLGFDVNFWNIGLKWENGKVFFDEGWFNFVEEAKVSIGDRLVFHRSSAYFKFSISMFPRSIFNTRDPLTGMETLVNILCLMFVEFFNLS